MNEKGDGLSQVNMSMLQEICLHSVNIDNILLPNMEGADDEVVTTDSDLYDSEIETIYDEDFKHAVCTLLTVGERLIEDRELDRAEVLNQAYEYMLEEGLLEYILEEISLEGFIERAITSLEANASVPHANLFEEGLSGVTTVLCERLISDKRSERLDLTDNVAVEILRESDELRKFKNLVISGEPRVDRMREQVAQYYEAINQNLISAEKLVGNIRRSDENEMPYATNFIYNFLAAHGYELDREFFEEGLVNLQENWNAITKKSIREIYNVLDRRLEEPLADINESGLQNVSPEYLVSEAYQSLIGIYKALNMERYYQVKSIKNKNTIEKLLKAIDSSSLGEFDRYIEQLNVQAQQYVQQGYFSLEALTEQMMPLVEFEEHEWALRRFRELNGMPEEASVADEVTERARTYNELIAISKKFSALYELFPQLRDIESEEGSNGIEVEKRIASLKDEYIDKVFYENTIFLHRDGEEFPASGNRVVSEMGLENLRVFPDVDRDSRRRVYRVELVTGEGAIEVVIDSGGFLDFGEPMLNQLPGFARNRLSLFVLRCIDEVTASAERDRDTVDGSDWSWDSKPIEGVRRRNHLMRLPEGRNPTREQIRLAWEQYGIDILRFEVELRSRGRLGSDERITFRESDPGDDEVLVNV